MHCTLSCSLVCGLHAALKHVVLPHQLALYNPAPFLLLLLLLVRLTELLMQGPSHAGSAANQDAQLRFCRHAARMIQSVSTHKHNPAWFKLSTSHRT
jgi:hypothetical protein